MPQSLERDVQQFVRLVGNATDAFTAALFLVDERRGDLLRLQACQSLSSHIVPAAEIPFGHGLVGWVAKNERATNASHFKGDTKTLKFYSKDEEIKSFAAAPLFDGDRVIGVLSVDSKRQYVFTDKAVKLLSEFAHTLSRIIIVGRRRIKLASEAAAFEGLSAIIGRITACSKMSELVGALKLSVPSVVQHDLLALALRSHEDEKFYVLEPGARGRAREALPLTHYRLGWVIQQARPVYIPDLKGAMALPGKGAEWKSFIGAPLMANNQVTGAVGLLSRKTAGFRPVDVKTLSILAAACSSAFTSLYLHSKEKSSIYTDPVTRTVTHRYLLENFGELEGEGALAIVNLVGFTKINHELGMEAGDKVMIDLASRLKEVVAEDGLVCRYYGDRFIVLLKDAREDKAAAAIRAVVDMIESRPFSCEDVDIYASPSIGLVFYPADGRGIEELIAKAQVASERAKNVPESRISVFGDPGGTPWRASVRPLKG